MRLRSCAEYAEQYRAAMAETDGPAISLMAAGQYSVAGGVLQMNGKPLHPNQRLLYETLYQLSPRSVAEFGSGCGLHLYNLSILMPDVRLYGCELCDEQIGLGRELFPDLKAEVVKHDITQPFGELVDVVFSLAVLMHLPDSVAIEAALSNMLASAKRQVVIVENWFDHDFAAAIRKLSTKPIYIYTRLSPEFGRKHILIASKVELNYSPLVDYELELARPLRENWTTDYMKIGKKDWMNESLSQARA